MSTDQIPLFVEDLSEAIRATVQALGGFKAVGHSLRPDRGVEEAGRWLADCLNSAKRERLDPEQLAWIRRTARQKGVHILAAFEMRDAGYAPPTPVEPEDERAMLQRQFVEAMRAQTELVKRLERLGVA